MCFAFVLGPTDRTTEIGHDAAEREQLPVRWNDCLDRGPGDEAQSAHGGPEDERTDLDGGDLKD